jgi:hypothetical protein
MRGAGQASTLGAIMGWTFALASRDPNLVGCVLQALHLQAPLIPSEPVASLGIGYYVDGEPLLERQPTLRAPVDLSVLAGDIDSEFLLAHAGPPGSSSKDENTQPFRFRSWLFAHAGELPGFAEVRSALHHALPPFWQGHRIGDTPSEYVFLHVLKRLREHTGLDPHDLAPGPLGAALREGIADVEQVLRDRGEPRAPTFSCVLTNGQSVAVLRAGRACSYRLMEGLVPCTRCGIDARTPEQHPTLRQHRQMRAVAFVTDAQRPGFSPVTDRSVITISPKLELKMEPL